MERSKQYYLDELITTKIFMQLFRVVWCCLTQCSIIIIITVLVTVAV